MTIFLKSQWCSKSITSTTTNVCTKYHKTMNHSHSSSDKVWLLQFCKRQTACWWWHWHYHHRQHCGSCSVMPHTRHISIVVACLNIMIACHYDYHEQAINADKISKKSAWNCNNLNVIKGSCVQFTRSF